MSKFTFPTLYKLTSTGALQQWQISTQGNVITTEYGQVGGKIQVAQDTIKSGKNIGKSNETTPEQQALAEAKAKWEKQTKKKYVDDPLKASAGSSNLDGNGYDCMLAQKFSVHGDKIEYPAYIQPKLDGHRCLAVVDNGVATLWSRTRKQINSMPHIIKELENVYPTGRHELDGELYNHAYKTNFEDISSLIRQDEPAPNCTEVQYHIYDKKTDKTFAERFEDLRLDLHCYEKAKAHLEYLKLVETLNVKNEEELMEMFDHFVDRGYEGEMVRNSDSLYEGKRSNGLQKIKEFDDAEFKISGIEEGRGKLAGHAIFLCKTKKGETFKAKLKGETENLKKLFEDHSLWKGKNLTVKYQGFTKYGIPRFPVGLRIRVDI